MNAKKSPHIFCSIALAFAAFTGVASANEEAEIERENGVVYITGTSLSDQAFIYIDGDDVEIEAWYRSNNRWRIERRDYDRDDIDRIVFAGMAGNDMVVNDTAIPLEAYGGSGDDQLYGGNGDDELRGGPGKDTLFGGDGMDLLEAGTTIEDERFIIGGDDMDIFVTPYLWETSRFRYSMVTPDVEQSDFDTNEDVRQYIWAAQFSWLLP